MNNTLKVYQDYVVFGRMQITARPLQGGVSGQVRKLAEHYPQRSLKQLTERQVFDYLIFRRDEQKLRLSTLNQAGCPALVLSGFPPARLAALEAV